MCNSKPDSPTPTPPPAAAPAPAPAPTPMPSDVSPLLTAEQRKNRLSALKFGALSTIKTSPQGIVGAGPDLQTPTATSKKTIGS